MTAYDKYRLLVDILTFVFMAGVLPLARWVHKIRTNDLQHVDAALTSIKESLERVEGKIDRHLEWHAQQK